MAAPLMLSVPFDHHDPQYQHYTREGTEVGRVLFPFQSKPITTTNLRQLGDALAPSAKKVKAANKVVDTVKSCMEACNVVSVDRVCVSGSYGKKTALPSFDVDLILFINGLTPPFESELENIRVYLSQNLNGIEMAKKSPYSVTFYLNGLKVDLLLAPNLVPGPSQNKRSDQHKALLQEIASAKPRDREERARYLSPAFSETIVEFMKRQPPFVNAAVRLAKLWKNSCSVGPFTFPRWFSSFLVELISSEAAKIELIEHHGDASLLRVLINFFNTISAPTELKLIFEENYKESDVPKGILKQRPLVLDPSNPYSNVAKRMNWNVIKLLAQDSLTVLKEAEKQDLNVSISDLFRPRLGEDVPRLYRQLNFQLRFVKSSSWLRRVQVRKISDLEGRLMNPGVTWRAMDKLERNDAARKAKPYILDMFNTLVEITDVAMAYHVAQETEKGIGEVTSGAKFIDNMLHEVFEQPQIDWVPTKERDEDRDVSLVFGQVPIPSAANDLRYLYFCLSFNVDDQHLDFICNSITADIRRRQQDEYND